MLQRSLRTVRLASAALLATAWLPCQDRDVAAPKRHDPASIRQRGIDFLLQNQEDGVFFMSVPGRGGEIRKMFDPGLTGLCLAALQSKPAADRTDAERAVIQSGLAWLVGQQAEDGSFGRRTLVYSTSAAVFGLSRAEGDAYAEPLARARKWLLGIQNIEGRSYSSDDLDYGSFGYGNSERGDLSNTSFAIQAIREAGGAEDEEGLVKALSFLQKLQNRRATNDVELEAKDEKTGEVYKVIAGNDGGATYYPGASPAGFDQAGDGIRHPRSYGSMTYALLKTYTLCGVGADDDRVRAAAQWIQSHWTVEVNPGSHPELGEKARYQGLFYYYMVMAQALDLMGVDEVQDGDRAVDWRRDLSAQLGRLQSENGAWRNDRNDRWYEGLEIICTAYAMLALQHCD